jgi:hypothetical protein
MLAYGIESGKEHRRVKQLEIKANNYADLHKASLLIEDALRTASFPGLSKNGLTLIRRLELGKIRISNNSTIFSQRLDQRFLALTPQAITLGQEEQPDASIVWFADAIQPYVLLAHLLASGVTPKSWYWPLAVPEWQPELDAGSALIRLLLSVSESQQGLLTVTAIIDRLVNNRTIDSVIDDLTVETAEQILGNLHIEPHKSQADNVGHEPIARKIILTHQWQNALQQWLPRLDEDDSRAILLALSAAISYDYPTAKFTLYQILHNSITGNNSDRVVKNADQYSDEGNGDYGDITRPQYGDDEPSEQLKKNDDNVGEGPIIQQKEQLSQKSINSILAPSGNDSAYAGLPMLINVLQRLGIQETLTNFPLLAELNLANHILWACVNKLVINPDDSACDWLTARYKLPVTNSYYPFVAPASWLTTLFSQHRAHTLVTRRVLGKSNKHLLCDSSGLAVLAIWQGKTPAAVSQLMEGRTIKFMPAAKDNGDLQQITGTYLFAIKRYLRRYARTGLRQMVARPARLAVTKTHLDVTLPMRTVDIDMRKAGLDIDPGWVPWLGRVVQFHYVENQE